MNKKHFLKLRGALAGQGLTLADLAKELNLTPQGLNEKMQSRHQFTLDEIIATCNFLGTEVDIFFDPELHNVQFKDSKNVG